MTWWQISVLLARFTQTRLKIVRLPQFLGCFRVHDEQKTSTSLHSSGAEEMARIRARFHGPDAPTDWQQINAHARRVRLLGSLTARLASLGIRV